MPAFNKERAIARMVLGCKKYVDTVVVVDEGSTDRTAMGARKEPQMNSRIRKSDYSLSLF